MEKTSLLRVLVVAILLGGAAARADQYQFTLTVGVGVEICEAYQQRLNQSEFTTLPYCDRPEDDRVEGFGKLDRVPLSVDEVEKLFVAADGLIVHGDVEHHIRSQSGRVSARDYAVDQLQSVRAGRPLVYRLEPRVDIDNDGSPDDVVAWRQQGCGGTYGPNNQRWLRPTNLIVLDEAGGLDGQRTRAIFGHPMGGSVTYTDANGRVRTLDLSRQFRTVGYLFGLLQFRNEYYFDTFYGSLGDLSNERVSAPGITSTLAVMKRSNDRTALVCELVLQE